MGSGTPGTTRYYRHEVGVYVVLEESNETKGCKVKMNDSSFLEWFLWSKGVGFA